MIKNYLKVAFRIITRYKSYSFINIAGLSVGIAVFILTFLYLQYEFSYDKFNENIQQVYRVEELWETGRAYGVYPITPAPLAPALMKEYPEIVNYVRIVPMEKRLLSTSDMKKKIYQEDGKYADNSIFEIFTFPFIKGDEKTALVEPFSMVLTDDTAEKFFPGEDSIGKLVRIKDRFDCKVTGVVKKPPHHSHLKFSYLVSISSYARAAGSRVFEDWDIDFVYSYILTQKEHSHKRLNEKISAFLNKHRKEADVDRVKLLLKPLSDIHLYSNTNFEMESATPVEIVFLFAAIGILVLLLVCVNFTNLSTAYASTRAKEVGVRKVSGANRFSMIKQFLSESLLLSFISFLIALFLVTLLIPEFNILLDTQLRINLFFNWKLLSGLIFITMCVGILSGSYPAFLLSSFQPAKVLKGPLKTGTKKSILRKILITSQYIFCMIFIIGSIAIYQQGNYLRYMDKGFEEENILVRRFDNLSNESIEKYKLLKSELLKSRYILNAAISSHLPHAVYDDIEVNWEGAETNQKIWTTWARVDKEFFDTYGIGFKEGRNFSEEFATDWQSACIINETALKKFGWDSSPLGKRINNIEYNVIGVVKDFHSSDLRLGIKPLILLPHRGNNGFYFSIKIASETRSEALDFIKSKFAEILPDELLELRLFKEILDETFISIKNWNKLIAYFSIISIIIASLGLYALAAFSTKQRTKEIGIRKVVGASLSRILLILIKEFIKIKVIAFLIAWPISYFIWNTFLQNFVYRINLNPWIFIGCGVIVLGVAALSVTYQTMKAAMANPVESLRYE